MTATSHSAPAALDLGTYSEQAEAFIAEIGEEYYLNHSGQKGDLALRPIYERHASLFSAERISALRDLASDAPADGSRGSGASDGTNGSAGREARLLARFAVDGYLERAVADLTEQIAEAETNTTVRWQGRGITYRQASVRVAEIPDRAERNALDAVYLEAVEAINPLREERLRRLHELARELGAPDYVALYSQAKGIDFDRLSISLQEFLAQSETVYFASLRRYLARIDIEQGDASRADLSHVLRGGAFDPWFRAERLVPVLERTLRVLGIELGAQPAVTLDLERRPNKSPRAFCVPVRVPNDVRLVLLPRGGHEDYDTALHEAGHAEHFANVAPELPVAYRYLGDDSLTEGYAFVLQYLALEPAWLAEHLGVTEGETLVYLDFAAFRKLYLLRRYVAKLLYELRLHRGMDFGVARAYYAGALSFLAGARFPESSYLADLDDGLYAGQYLRAWLLEACVSSALRQRFGATWWRHTGAGDLLRELWARGQELTAEELVAQLGYDGLDWRPVLRHIRTNLIGEMSGYGGPNLTTRAGTRKV